MPLRTASLTGSVTSTSPACARVDDARRQVDVARRSSRRRGRRCGRSGCRCAGASASRNPPGSRSPSSSSATGSVPTIITPSPMFLTTRAPVGSEFSTDDDELLDQVERLGLALLLGELHEADEVGERDRDVDLAQHLAAARFEVLLHARDQRLLDEVAQVAAVQVAPSAARGCGSSSRDQLAPAPRRSARRARPPRSAARARRCGRGSSPCRRSAAPTARTRAATWRNATSGKPAASTAAMLRSAVRSSSSRCSSIHVGKPIAAPDALDQRRLEARRLRRLRRGRSGRRARETAPRRSRTRAGRPRRPLDLVERVARSRRRVTMRACAAAARVQRPRYSGTIPCLPHAAASRSTLRRGAPPRRG